MSERIVSLRGNKMKLLIIEASYPKDFFSERLDGHVTHHLTKLLRIDSKLVYALDKRHLAKAVTLAAKGGYDVVHLSCHGADDGIAVTDNTDIDWPDFVQLNANRYSPEALVMSSCYGAADGLADEFEKVKSRPKIIFGSTDERDYNEYAVTWTILYNLFRTDGVHRVVAREALRAINAIVHRNFRYLRWDESPSLSAIPGRRPALCNNREGQEEIHEVAITRLRYTHVGDIRRLLAPPGPLLCRFSDAGNDEALHTLMRPASEKRQGTKSRRVGHPAVPLALWGFGSGVRVGEAGPRSLS